MNRLVFFGLLALTFLSSESLYGQYYNMQNISDDIMLFSFGFRHPSLELENYDLTSKLGDIDATTGIYELSLSRRINENLYINASFPVASYSYSNNIETASESSLGNIYIGLQTVPRHRGLKASSFFFGVMLPTASDGRALPEYLTASLADRYHPGKFTTKKLTLYANAAFRKDYLEGSFISVEAGPDILISTGGNQDDTDAFVHFGIKGGLLVPPIMLSSEFNGTFTINAYNKNFSDRFVNMINFGATYMGTRLRPSLFYQMYFNEYINEAVTGIVGLRLDYSFPDL